MILEMSRRLRGRDEVRFFLHWLRRPARLGAVVPSGHALAAALAAEIDIQAPGAVVELGSGTGRVTAALIAAGVAPETRGLVLCPPGGALPRGPGSPGRCPDA
jgi:phospholipid N-methyltransferase